MFLDDLRFRYRMRHGGSTWPLSRIVSFPECLQSGGELTPTAALAGEAPDGWLCQLTLDDGPSVCVNDIGYVTARRTAACAAAAD